MNAIIDVCRLQQKRDHKVDDYDQLMYDETKQIITEIIYVLR